MKFAITGTDRYWGVFEALIGAGWQPLKLFTAPLITDLAGQRAVVETARRSGAATQVSPMTEHDLQDLQRQGCDVLVVASYDWKIGDWTPYLKYAVNFHASPLPEARGAYPAIRAILEARTGWAVTCHKISPRFDAGDILAAQHFALQPDECHESMDLKIQMAAKKLAMTVAKDFVDLWNKAAPQAEGSYWKKSTLKDSVIDFTQPVESIRRHIRAFGNNGSLAHVGDAWLVLKRAVGWGEPHQHRPGSVVHVFNQSMVVAAPDGYIGLLDVDIASPMLVAQLQKPLALNVL